MPTIHDINLRPTKEQPMKTATTIVLLVSMTVNANAFIASTDCRFGRSFGTCTTTVLRPQDAGPRIIRAEPAVDIKRDAPWMAFCKPSFRTDQLGVMRYVYARSGCEYGRTR